MLGFFSSGPSVPSASSVPFHHALDLIHEILYNSSMPTHKTFKDHSLYLLMITAELMLLLTLVQVRATEGIVLSGNALYGPMREQRSARPEAKRSETETLRKAAPRRAIRAKQTTSKQTRSSAISKSKSSARPAWVGRFSTQGLSEDDIKILQMQCATGVRKC